MKSKIEVIIFALIPLSLLSWERGYELNPSYSLSYDVLELPGSNMIWLAEAPRAILLETNRGGDSLRVFRFNDIDSTFVAHTMEFGVDSTIWLGGHSYNGSNFDASILILNSDCSFIDYIRYEIYNEDFIDKTIFDSDNNCIVAGHNYESGNYLGWLFKTGTDGTVIWADTFDYGVNGWFTDILEKPGDGYYLLGGAMDTSDAVDRPLIIRVSEAGDSINGVLLPLDTTYISCAEFAGDSGIYLFGATQGAWNQVIWVAMVDLELNLLWEEEYNLMFDSYIFGSASISDNRITLGYRVFEDIGLIFYDAMNADTIRSIRYTTPEVNETGFALKQMSNGDYAIAGRHRSDLWRSLGFRVDSLGNHVPAAIGETDSRPKAFEIIAHPNPFNSAVSIIAPVGAKVEIYNINGRRIPPPTPLEMGEHGKSPLLKGDLGGFVWRPGHNIGSGVYLLRATAPSGDTATKRIVYLK